MVRKKKNTTDKEETQDDDIDFANLSLPSPLGATMQVDKRREELLASMPRCNAAFWEKHLKPTNGMKWNPKKIRTCLEIIATFGVLSRGAYGAGMSYEALHKFMERDPEMRQAVNEALKVHETFVEELVYQRGAKGWVEPVIGKGGLVRDHTGKIIMQHKYDPKAFEMYVKRHNKAYRERHELDVNIKSGVLVVPGLPDTQQSFEETFGGLRKNDTLLEGGGGLPVIDVTPEEEDNKQVINRS